MLAGSITGLRAIERTDLAQLLEWRNRPEYRRFFREHRELSSEQQSTWFENTVQRDPNTRMFSIVELANGRLLGASGLCYIDWVNKNADFSLYIGADNLYIDDKFAPDAARIMMRHAFGELGIHRLWAEVYDFDQAKQNLFKHLGFALDGRHRETHWGEGRWNDSLFFGLLAHEAPMGR